MSEAQRFDSFPCPGCGTPLVTGTFDVNVQGERTRCFERIDLLYRPADTIDTCRTTRILQAHFPMSIECSARALVAAVRSLDEGRRQSAQINQAQLDGFLRKFTPALDLALSTFTPPAPARSPLVGLSCVHRRRLDERCIDCEGLTSDHPVGARLIPLADDDPSQDPCEGCGTSIGHHSPRCPVVCAHEWPPDLHDEGGAHHCLKCGADGLG